MPEHWWDKLQYQCPFCKEYNCFFVMKETEEWYQKGCDKCGKLGYKKEKIWVEFENRNEKPFMRSNKIKEWVECYLLKTPKFIKVVPKLSTVIVLDTRT